MLQKYSSAGPTRYELYDMRNAEGRGFTSREVDRIVENAKTGGAARPPGSKTALVASRDVHFGMSRVYQAVSEIEGLAWKVETFRSIEAAYAWLDLPQQKREGEK
jgi:hypothetical protein